MKTTLRLISERKSGKGFLAAFISAHFMKRNVLI